MQAYFTRALCAGAVLAFAASAAIAADVEILNASDRVIEHVNISAVRSNQWGPDQLGNKVVPPGTRFTIYGIQPGHYDLRLLMKDGTQCIVEDAALVGDKTWELTNRHC